MIDYFWFPRDACDVEATGYRLPHRRQLGHWSGHRPALRGAGAKLIVGARRVGKPGQLVVVIRPDLAFAVLLDVSDAKSVEQAISGWPPKFAQISTKFSDVRFRGAKDKVEAVYVGMQPPSATDIGDVAFWATSLPQHININAVELIPVARSMEGFRCIARETIVAFFSCSAATDL